MNRDDQMGRGSSGLGGNQPQIANDATVYDASGAKLGKVQAVDAQSQSFTLAKGMLFPHDYYVPFSAISRVDTNGVYLSVTKDQVENQGWDNQPTSTGKGQGVGDRIRDALNPDDDMRDNPNTPRY